MKNVHFGAWKPHFFEMRRLDFGSLGTCSHHIKIIKKKKPGMKMSENFVRNKAVMAMKYRHLLLNEMKNYIFLCMQRLLANFSFLSLRFWIHLHLSKYIFSGFSQEVEMKNILLFLFPISTEKWRYFSSRSYWKNEKWGNGGFNFFLILWK